MPRLQGLLFDLDGTLLDSTPDILHAINLMLEQLGARNLSINEIRPMIGDGAMELVRKALAAVKYDAGDDIFPYVQKYINSYRGINPDPSQVFPHAREALEFFLSKGVKLGVCTNKQEAASHWVLEQLDLSKYFEFVAGGNTFPYHKPNPEHVNGVITALDVPREGCAFIGDGKNDVFAAHGAKIPCIVVTHGNVGNFSELGADAVISGYEELAPALQKLGFTTD